jgi:putative oxidoreductase
MTVMTDRHSTEASAPAALLQRINGLFAAIPHWLIALVARFSIAMVFWKSGQTKVQGFQLDPIAGIYEFGLPRFADSTILLFEEEYKLPILPAELAAFLATAAEHVFPLLIIVGLATRFSAFALLVMTAVIQIFVYPSAYPTHGVWAAVLMFLMWRGAGLVSLDHLIGRGRNV